MLRTPKPSLADPGIPAAKAAPATAAKQPVKAPLWRRFAALVYDIFILAALSFAYGAALTLCGALLKPTIEDNYLPMFDSLWVSLGWVSVLVTFYLYFWRRGGQTIGMKTWRLKLVDKTTARPAFTQLMARVLIAVPGLLLLGVGYFYRWLDAEGDCLHDRLSRTMVVVLPKGQ